MCSTKYVSQQPMKKHAQPSFVSNTFWKKMEVSVFFLYWFSHLSVDKTILWQSGNLASHCWHIWKVEKIHDIKSIAQSIPSSQRVAGKSRNGACSLPCEFDLCKSKIVKWTGKTNGTQSYQLMSLILKQHTLGTWADCPLTRGCLLSISMVVLLWLIIVIEHRIFLKMQM